MDGDPESGASTSESGLSAPTLDAATGYGVGLTVVEAVLLALGYYGVLAINETGEFGQAVPERSTVWASRSCSWPNCSIAVTSARWRSPASSPSPPSTARCSSSPSRAAVPLGGPEAALSGLVGVSVFAVALVVSALAYLGYLTIVERGG
jgi:hypothetical protein